MTPELTITHYLSVRCYNIGFYPFIIDDIAFYIGF